MSNHVITKARSTAKPSGNGGGTRTAGVLPTKAVKKVTIPWQMNRLRNQAVQFFAHGDPTRRRDLSQALTKARTFSQVQRELLHGRTSSRGWARFLDAFFGATTRKTRRA